MTQPYPVRRCAGFYCHICRPVIIPNYFVRLQELPLTENGKIDHARLPQPFDQPQEADQEDSSRLSAEEKALQAIFMQVLRHREIGIHDNYFDLGGDSIKAIQISASANQIGIMIKPGQLFDHQTICELASVVKKQMPVAARQDNIAGNAPLTPVQKWFFTQPENALNRFSHSVVVRLRNRFSTQQIQRAINKLLDHHDVLRHRFEKKDSGWIQHAVAQRPDINVSLVESTAATRQQQITALESSLSSQLDIRSGQLLACSILASADSGSDELVIVIHHLAIDAVSWGIFLDDLDLLLKQIIQNQALLLPFKTSAFIDWARTLDDYMPTHEQLAAINDLKTYHRIVDTKSTQQPTTKDSISTATVLIPMALLRIIAGQENRRTGDRITGLGAGRHGHSTIRLLRAQVYLH